MQLPIKNNVQKKKVIIQISVLSTEVMKLKKNNQEY